MEEDPTVSVEIKKFGAGEPELLTEFADRHGLTVVIHERDANRGRLPRYFAMFDPMAEVMENGMLGVAAGDGETPEEAMRKYAKSMAGRRIVIGAYTRNRKEIEVPNDFRHEERKA
jgi:hypothetical protein